MIVQALGTLEAEGKPSFLRLLIQNSQGEDKILEIEESLWLPLEKFLEALPFSLKIKVSGTRVIKAERVEKLAAEP